MYDDELGMCVNSGTSKDLCGPANYVVDPFSFEVHDEANYVWLCDNCLQDRNDDI